MLQSNSKIAVCFTLLIFFCLLVFLDPAFSQDTFFADGKPPVFCIISLEGTILASPPFAAHTLTFTLTAGQENAVTRARLLWNSDNPSDLAADNDAFLLKIMNKAVVAYLRDNDEATAKTVAEAYKNATQTVKNQVNTLLGVSP